MQLETIVVDGLLFGVCGGRVVARESADRLTSAADNRGGLTDTPRAGAPSRHMFS